MLLIILLIIIILNFRSIIYIIKIIIINLLIYKFGKIGNYEYFLQNSQ